MFIVSSCWHRKYVKKSSIYSAHIFPMCVCVCVGPPVFAQESGGDQLPPAAAAVSSYTESQPVTASVPGLLTRTSPTFMKRTLENLDGWCKCATAEVSVNMKPGNIDGLSEVCFSFLSTGSRRFKCIYCEFTLIDARGLMSLFNVCLLLMLLMLACTLWNMTISCAVHVSELSWVSWSIHGILTIWTAF